LLAKIREQKVVPADVNRCSDCYSKVGICYDQEWGKEYIEEGVEFALALSVVITAECPRTRIMKEGAGWAFPDKTPIRKTAPHNLRCL
jgi:hypothetical protein